MAVLVCDSMSKAVWRAGVVHFTARCSGQLPTVFISCPASAHAVRHTGARSDGRAREQSTPEQSREEEQSARDSGVRGGW
jgi:hypothetical protein